MFEELGKKSSTASREFDWNVFNEGFGRTKTDYSRYA
jgi:hypothetical protein